MCDFTNKTGGGMIQTFKTSREMVISSYHWNMLQIASKLRNIFDLGSEIGFTIYMDLPPNKIHVL